MLHCRQGLVGFPNDRMSTMRSHCLKSSRHTKPTRSFYNPIDFDPAEVLPLYLHRYADYARYFLHVLYTQRIFKDIKDEFVPLKAAYLRRFFPDNTVYKQVRAALLESGTIVCDGIYYQADVPSWRNYDQQRRYGKSFGYKLGPKWSGVRHEQVTLTTKPLFKSITKVNKKRQSEIVTLPHQHIWRCLQDIKIDHQAAVQELEGLMVGATPEEIDGYTGQCMICDGINNGDLFWHVCQFGRIYNNVTALKKSLRQYLRVSNHSLVGCDVTNSQPLLVGLLCRHNKQGLLSNNLCNNAYCSQFDHYIEIDQEFLDYISSTSPQKQEEEGGGGDRNSLYDVVLTRSSQLVPGDVERYIKLCEEGKLYDELMLLDHNKTDRDTFKKQIFIQVFYGKNCYEGKLTKLFAQEFPTVWETIRAIKKEDHKRLSHQMLRLESEIVINRAVRQCGLEGIWVVTIHDCLVTYPEQAERVKQIMEEAFESVGVTPTIKLTAFNLKLQEAR
jgi:hypothetical protein